MRRKSLAAAVFCVSFLLALFLSYPSISPYRDSGDFAAAAETFGIAHPPGYPAYVLAARVARVAIPFGNPVARLNLLSALAFAGAISFLFFELSILGGTFAAFAGAVLAAMCPALLSQSGLAEVYSLAGLFASILLCRAARFAAVPPRRAAWLALFFVWGAGVAMHQGLVLLGPCLAVPAWRRLGVRGLSAAALLAFAGAAAAALFLPLRAGSAVYAWGEPDSLSGFWRVVTRADYGAGTLSTRNSAASFGEGALFWFRAWASEWGPAGCVLGAAGLLFAAARRAAWGAVPLLAWAFTGPFFGGLARLVPSELSSAILQPALGAPGLAAAFSAALLIGEGWARGGWRRTAAAALAGTYLAFHGASGVAAWNHRHDMIAPDYARQLFRSVPPGGCLLMISDQAAFSTAALQAVWSARTDLPLLVNAELPWRWRRARRAHPELFSPGQQDGVTAFVDAQAGRRAIFTEGMQTGLLDALCPSGGVARLHAGARGPACAAEMERSLSMWEFYIRRPSPRRVLAADYYGRVTLKAVSSNAYNAGLLLTEAGRTDAGRQAYARALFWSPDRMLRWEAGF